MSDLKIYNEFGIIPSSNCEAAGLDFFIPNIKNTEKYENILAAFGKSFGKAKSELEKTINSLSTYVSAMYGPEKFEGNELNILHLFLSLDAYSLRCKYNIDEMVEIFCEDYFIFDSVKNVPGIKCKLNDHVKFNTGIKVALDNDTAGIFFNKSGKGTKGWDVRAAVVDEDYSGFVHMSAAYTKDSESDGVIFVGDKFSQMVVLPIIHKTPVEISGNEYDKLMENSKRGSNGFGSSDIKH